MKTPESSSIHTEVETCSATAVAPFLQSFYGSHVSKVYAIQVEKIINMERWRFYFYFFQAHHLGDKMTLYFVTQTEGKLNIALLTELQNQNWQILEEHKLTIAKLSSVVHAAWAFLVFSHCCSAAPTVQLTLVWLLKQVKKRKIILP